MPILLYYLVQSIIVLGVVVAVLSFQIPFFFPVRKAMQRLQIATADFRYQAKRWLLG